MKGQNWQPIAKVLKILYVISSNQIILNEKDYIGN